MNEVLHTVYGHYIRLLADQMGLRDWEIDLAPDEISDGDTAAMCSTTYGRKLATVHFGAGFFDEPLETQRYYCVHELLHCHFHGIKTALCNAHGRLGSDAYEVLKGTHADAMEYAVDGIGVAYAKCMPLPPTPEDDEDSRELPANVVPFPVERVA